MQRIYRYRNDSMWDKFYYLSNIILTFHFGVIELQNTMHWFSPVLPPTTVRLLPRYTYYICNTYVVVLLNFSVQFLYSSKLNCSASSCLSAPSSRRSPSAKSGSLFSAGLWQRTSVLYSSEDHRWSFWSWNIGKWPKTCYEIILFSTS